MSRREEKRCQLLYGARSDADAICPSKNDIAGDIMESVKLLLDTAVIVAGLRSPTGASAELLRMARRGRVVLVASVPLFVEYEAKCTEDKHLAAAGLSREDVEVFLDGLAAIVQPVSIHYAWRPQLNDPADEMVLEAAVNGGARVLVTFNQRHFGDAPRRFGIDLLLPSEALRRVR